MINTISILVLLFNLNWQNSIDNPANEEFVEEVAFNLDIPVEEVTQEQFNERYLK